MIYERIDEVLDWDGIEDLDDIACHGKANIEIKVNTFGIAARGVPLTGSASCVLSAQANGINRKKAVASIQVAAQTYANANIGVVMSGMANVAVNCQAEMVAVRAMQAMSECLLSCTVEAKAKFAANAEVALLCVAQAKAKRKYWATETMAGNAIEQKDKISGQKKVFINTIQGQSLQYADKISGSKASGAKKVYGYKESKKDRIAA